MVCVVLRFDLSDQAVGDGKDLRAGVEVLCESGNAGIGIRRRGWIVLIEVLGRDGVFIAAL